MSEKESRKNLHEERVRMVLLHDLVRKGSTKDCVDVSVEITETINLVNQNTKRLKFGATLQVSLVKERSSAAMGDFVGSSVGVPQGSVLRPLCFLYTGDLERKAMKYELGFNQYADDTQIYGHCNNEGTELQMRMSDCVDELAA